MAQEGVGAVIMSFPAGEDLSGKQYRFVKLNSSRQVVLATARGEAVLGVLQNKPTSGQAASVLLSGLSKVESDAAVAVGNLVETSADGQASPATTTGTGLGGVNTSDTGSATDAVRGGYIMGMCVGVATANAAEIATVFINPMGVVATTAV